MKSDATAPKRRFPRGGELRPESPALLDAVRERHNLRSDTKLAKFLGLERSRVSLYRTGTRKLDPEACIRIADALDVPAAHVLALIQAERARRSEHRRIWLKAAKALLNGKVAAALTLAAAGGLLMPPVAESAGAHNLDIRLNRRRGRRPGSRRAVVLRFPQRDG